MKAKEYFQKYGERLQNPETSDVALNDLVKDLLDETKMLMDQRGVRTDKACMAVLNEMNDKWNLVNMFPVEVLKRNGLRAYFMTILKGGEAS